ncbi:MAG: RNA polymerase sigma-70 factor [Bacteroidota bacterium]
MNLNPGPNDKQLMELVRDDDHKAFRSLFDRYYKYLVVTSYNVLGDPEKSKDAAQEVFLELWKRRTTIQITSSLKSYLRRAVINKTLNLIKAQRLDFNAPGSFSAKVSKDHSPQAHLEKEDLQEIINQTIEQLPEKCRLIFTLCRFEHMSHKEIADQLGISKKTVENQMTKALKILRTAIAPYLSVVLFWIYWLLNC